MATKSKNTKTSKLIRKKEQGARYAKNTFVAVAAMQGFRLFVNQDAETLASVIVVIIFGGALFAGVAYVIGYISGK